MYTGVIIQESLTGVDKPFLKMLGESFVSKLPEKRKKVLAPLPDGRYAKLHVLKTRVEEVTPRHKTPWVKAWILHTVEIDEEDAEKWAEWLSRHIDDSHDHPWYADFRNDKIYYVIYPGKVFKIDRKNPEENKKAQEYGKTVGIPEYQLDWEL